MKKWPMIANGVLVVLLAGLAQAVVPERKPETIYRGKTLSAWLKTALGYGADASEARNALQYRGSSSDPETRGLWRSNGVEIVARLVGALETRDNLFWKPYNAVRQKAPRVLGKRLPNWEEPRLVRLAALLMLGQVRPLPRTAAPALCKAAKNDLSQANRYWALEILSGIGFYSEETSAIMLNVLVSEPAPGLRAHALIWFMETGADPERVVPVLVKALRDPSPEIRRGAAAALASYGPPAIAIEPLRNLANTDEDYVKWVAWKALSNIDPEAAARVAPIIPRLH